MSSSLKWNPEGKGRDFPGNYGPGLKNALRRRFGGAVVYHLALCDRGFVEGLVAAEVAGAEALLDLLDKHEAIEVWEES